MSERVTFGGIQWNCNPIAGLFDPQPLGYDFAWYAAHHEHLAATSEGYSDQWMGDDAEPTQCKCGKYGVTNGTEHWHSDGRCHNHKYCSPPTGLKP